jgi:hypothetical protein
LRYRLLGGLACLLATACNPAPTPALAQEGRVIDSVTGAGIAAATVSDGARATQTDATGHFDLPGPPTGSAGRLMARAPGYRASAAMTAEVQAREGVIRLHPFRPHALYLSAYGIGSQTLRENALDLIRAGAANALVIDLKGDRGLIPYPSAIPLAQRDGARALTTIPDLAALVRSLHADGVYAIARIVVFKDNPLAAARPDLAVHLGNGAPFRDREGMVWTDPFQPEVRDYNIAVAVEAARAGFDEIQFDYVRFPDCAERLRFAGEPTQVTRLRAIAALLTEARRRLLPYNVYLAADVFGYICWNFDDTGIGQRLEEFMPLVDYLSPMLYPSGFQYGIPGYRNPVEHPYEIVRQSLDRARARVGGSPERFRPWLQAFRDYAFDRRAFGPEQVAAQIRAAADFGTDGWMLWNPRNDYRDAGLAGAEASRQPDPPAPLPAASVSASPGSCS